MSIKKQFLKRKPVCKVTFRIPEELGNSAKTAHVVGEFNNWDFSSTPMKKLKNRRIYCNARSGQRKRIPVSLPVG